jgi:WD40 repeat protein
MPTELTIQPKQLSSEIQPILAGNKNQAIGGMSGGTAFGTVEGSVSVIYNYYYHSESVRSESVESPAIDGDVNLCPYRGLFHFSPNDAEFFFGREVFVEELFAATRTCKFIPVLGASGSGKSSVVLAGLVPKLQNEGHWLFTHFRPDSDPFHALALALVPLYTPHLDDTDKIIHARKLSKALGEGEIPLADVFAQIHQNHPMDRVLLIADQFEEIYTLCTDQKVRRSFLDALLASFPSCPSQSHYKRVLVATMRADFLGNALLYPPFGDVLKTDIKLIRSMKCEELEQVIVKPAGKLGVTFQEGLVKRILDDVESEPGNLPLLEFALTELWKWRKGKQLTHAAYEDIGEVKGALARHADEKYSNLTDDEKEKVRRIFIQLVHPGEGTEDTRRLATKAELGEASWGLVKQLADARLVVTSRNPAEQETVEVVHEALIRNWSELRQWMDTDRCFRAWQDRLRIGSHQWKQTQRDEGALLRGAALVEAEEKLKQRQEDLCEEEQDFIQASVALRDREQKQRSRRRQLTISGLASGLVLALSLTGVALLLWRRAETVQEGQINALIQYSSVLRDSNQEFDALIEGIRAGQQLKRQKVSFDTQNRVAVALRQAVYKVRERNRLEGHNHWVNSVSFSPDGKMIATASDDNTIKLWNVHGQLLSTFTGHGARVTRVVFSPDGKTIASASADETVKLWNTAGKELQTLTGHENAVWGVNFSPDGKTIVTASDDQTIKLWSTDGKLHKTLAGHKDWVRSVSFSPDGKTIASASRDKTIKVWSQDGQLLHTFTGHKDWVDSISFSPDGKTIASASRDKTIKVWSQDGQLLHTFTGHDDWVRSVSFSPNGKTIVTSSADRTFKLWSQDGQLLHTSTGHKDWVNSASFSPDGKIIASASHDKTVKLWSLDGQLFRTLSGHSDWVHQVVFSPDGKTIASASADKTVKLWSLNGQLLRTIQGHHDQVNSVSFSPDGQLVASASNDRTVKLWSLNGQLLHTIQGHHDRILDVRFSPDSKTIASASADRTVKLWNTAGKKLQTLAGHQKGVMSVSFSPDGKTIASASSDYTIKLWSLDGRFLRTLPVKHNSWVRSVSFSPDSKTIASASDDKTIKLWSLNGRELHTLQGHNDEVKSVSFSPDGKTIASASADKTVKLWSIDGQLLDTLTGHQKGVMSVSFSPDGKTIASTGDDKSVILWKFDLDKWEMLSKLDLDELLVRGCIWVHDYLKTNLKVSKSDHNLCDGIRIQ